MRNEPKEKLVILSLCDRSGNWSRPYKDAGYEVIRVDLSDCKDVRTIFHLGMKVHGILAAPPCDHFASSGARWWAEKGPDAIEEGLSIVYACLRAVAIYNPKFWALENPVGRLKIWLGPPTMSFDPCDYGDPYTKKTLLWGKFSVPLRKPVPPHDGSKMHSMSSAHKHKRSVTPNGFARAFFEANP